MTVNANFMIETSSNPLSKYPSAEEKEKEGKKHLLSSHSVFIGERSSAPKHYITFTVKQHGHYKRPRHKAAVSTAKRALDTGALVCCGIA